MATTPKGKDRFNRSRAHMVDLAARGRRAPTLEEFERTYAEFVDYCAFIAKPYTVGTRHDDRLLLAAIGTASEAGELLDVFKKIYFHDKARRKTISKDRRKRAIAEAGDVLWYFTLWLKEMGLSMRDVCQANMEALAVRS